MESSGRYGEADELKSSMEQHGIGEYDRIYNRSDARDGLSCCSYAGDMAERAYDDLKYAERREEERREREYEQDLNRQDREQQENFSES